MKTGKIVLTLVVLLFLGCLGVFSAPSTKTITVNSPSDVAFYKNVTLTETTGINRVNEPVDIFVTFDTPATVNNTRVLDSSLNEIPSQLWNITLDGGGKATSANVAFLANCSASSSAVYTILYDNMTARPPPTYDGLRTTVVAPFQAYNVTAVKAGVEYNYLYHANCNIFDLYSQGDRIAWAGGPPGWTFSTLYTSTMWEGPPMGPGNNTAWFGHGKNLTILNSGPVFVDLNYTEAYGIDLGLTIYDYNMTQEATIRIWYQPDLNPLVYTDFIFKCVTNMANYTLGGPICHDTKMADSETDLIYQHLTYKITNGTIITENLVRMPSPGFKPFRGSIWNTTHSVGWFTYNGSRTDSPDTPGANVGYIPIDIGGTVAKDPWGNPADYTLLLWNKPEGEPWGSHVAPWLKGTFNMSNGDIVRVKDYFVVHDPIDGNIAPIMDEKASKLRNPLTYTVSSENLATWRNVAVTNVKTYSTKHGPAGSPLTPVTECYSTWTIDIDATVKNKGVFSESFTVQVFYGNATGNYTIGSAAVTLDLGVSTTKTFTWDVPEIPFAHPYPTYTIYANVSVVPSETNIADNTMASSPVTVKWRGDGSGDGYVGLPDLMILAMSYGKSPGDAGYNPQADYSGDGLIGLPDLMVLAMNYGKGPLDP